METHSHLVTHLPVTNYFDSSRAPTDDLHFAVSFIHPQAEQTGTGYLVLEHGQGSPRNHRVGLSGKYVMWIRNVGMLEQSLGMQINGVNGQQAITLKSGEDKKINSADIKGSAIEFTDHRRTILGDLELDQSNGVQTFDLESDNSWLNRFQRRIFIPDKFESKDEKFTVQPLRIGLRRIFAYEGMVLVSDTKDHSSRATENHKGSFQILCGDEEVTHLRLQNRRSFQRTVRVKWFHNEGDVSDDGYTDISVPGNNGLYDVELKTGYDRVDIHDAQRHATATVLFNRRRLVSYTVR